MPHPDSRRTTSRRFLVSNGWLRVRCQLALASEVIYGTQASTRDPARFAFAHGGKDGIPFPVDRETYDKTIDVLRRAVDRSSVDRSERVRARKRLGQFTSA